MSQIAKAVALISGVGVIGGVGAYSAGLFTKENPKTTEEIKKVSFKEKLAEEGFELITDTVESNWTEILKAYSSATINSFSGKQETGKTKEQLKANCDSHLDKVIENNYRENKDYQKLTKWCVKKTKMDAVLKNAGFRALKFESKNEATEKNLLDDKVNRLTKDRNTFEAFKKAAGNTITSEATINVEVLQKGCTGLQTNTIETIQDDFLGKFYLAKEFCFVKE